MMFSLYILTVVATTLLPAGLPEEEISGQHYQYNMSGPLGLPHALLDPSGGFMPGYGQLSNGGFLGPSVGSPMISGGYGGYTGVPGGVLGPSGSLYGTGGGPTGSLLGGGLLGSNGLSGIGSGGLLGHFPILNAVANTLDQASQRSAQNAGALSNTMGHQQYNQGADIATNQSWDRGTNQTAGKQWNIGDNQFANNGLMQSNGAAESFLLSNAAQNVGSLF